jgi:hypothetical protein
MKTLIDRIEATAKAVGDTRLPLSVRLAAADEVLMFAGPALVRASLAKHVGVWAGCIHGPDGECQCDEWRLLLELRQRGGEVWPDAMDWTPDE